MEHVEYGRLLRSSLQPHIDLHEIIHIPAPSRTAATAAKRFRKTQLRVPLTQLNIPPPPLHTVTYLRHARLDPLSTARNKHT